MQSPSEALASNPPIPDPPSGPYLPHSHPQQAAPRRRHTQRVFLKDRPEVICQLQIN
uniref:Predicted protein n=1 Tax=Hordeum vulgare subsp. vulgare TaxID=112509 RepID=F2DU79_HORVV|nr:predicted protein [Hordeum vulgare subsp. vulgare]